LLKINHFLYVSELRSFPHTPPVTKALHPHHIDCYIKNTVLKYFQV